MTEKKTWHYHTMKDRDGSEIWKGQYDLYALWENFGIPNDLHGQSILDIGTATGFFAFECERLGASPVVATELPDITSWDSRKGVDYDGVNIPAANSVDFWDVHSRLASAVELFSSNISDPPTHSMGQYDWVIFGSLMTHVRDIMLALTNVHTLTRGRAVVISSYLPGDSNPCLHLIQTDRPFDWWVPTKPLVPLMLKAAGFSRIVETGDFILVHRDGPSHVQGCWHAFP